MEGRKLEFDKVFRALGDKHRLYIMDLLMEREMNAGELLEKVNVVQSTLSHHMKCLCESGLVIARKERKWIYYSVSPGAVESAGEFLKRYLTGISESAQEPEEAQVSKDIHVPQGIQVSEDTHVLQDIQVSEDTRVPQDIQIPEKTAVLQKTAGSDRVQQCGVDEQKNPEEVTADMPGKADVPDDRQQEDVGEIQSLDRAGKNSRKKKENKNKKTSDKKKSGGKKKSSGKKEEKKEEQKEAKKKLKKGSKKTEKR